MPTRVNLRQPRNGEAPLVFPEQFYAACTKPSNRLTHMVTHALKLGYGLDTADVNGNHAHIGSGILAAVDAGVNPSDIVATLKVWPTDFGHGKTIAAIIRMRDELLQALPLRLALTDVRLIGMLHWPGKDLARMAAAYKELEQCVRDGLIAHTAIANFEGNHIRALHNSDIEIRPSLLQVERSPYFAPSSELMIACRETWKYPLMAIGVFGGRDNAPTILRDPIIKWATGMGQYARNEEGETTVLHAPQAILAYLMRKRFIPVSGTMNPEHLGLNAWAPFVKFRDRDFGNYECLSGHGARTTPRPDDFDPRLPTAVLRAANRHGFRGFNPHTV